MNERLFIRKERDHLSVLRQRLDYLRSEQGTEDWKNDPTGFIAGEANALTWALSVIEGKTEPVELRVERLERRLRATETRLGRAAQDEMLRGSDGPGR